MAFREIEVYGELCGEYCEELNGEGKLHHIDSNFKAAGGGGGKEEEGEEEEEEEGSEEEEEEPEITWTPSAKEPKTKGKQIGYWKKVKGGVDECKTKCEEEEKCEAFYYYKKRKYCKAYQGTSVTEFKKKARKGHEWWIISREEEDEQFHLFRENQKCDEGK